MTDLPLPDAPTRQLSEHEPSGSSSNNADAGDTSMPTEVLRHLGESSQKDPALQEESPGMKALRSVALSNEWDTSAVSWSDLRTVIQNQIEQHLTRYAQSEAKLFDNSLTPPYPLTIDQAKALQSSLFASLNAFTAPPFTIQRLCELTLTPSIYATLPKYIRALQRCLGVSSAQSDFPPEESLVTLPSANLHPSITHPLGGDTTQTLRSRSSSLSSVASSVSSSSASSSQSGHSTPLLSPIPWLNRDPDSPEPQQMNGSSSNNTSPSKDSSSVSSPSLPNGAGPVAASPIGGRIDELDPGPEARETGAADSNPASLSEQPQALSGLGLALHGAGGNTTTPGHALEERFTPSSASPQQESSTTAAGVPEDVEMSS